MASPIRWCMQKGRIAELAHPAMLADVGRRDADESVEPVVIVADLGLAERYTAAEPPPHDREIVTLSYRDIDLVNEDIARESRAAREEQAACPRCSPLSDVYALGVVAHELCAVLPLRLLPARDTAAKRSRISRGVALASGVRGHGAAAPRVLRLLAAWMTAPERRRRPTAAAVARLVADLKADYLVGAALLNLSGSAGEYEHLREGLGLVAIGELAVLAGHAQQRESPNSPDDECVRAAAGLRDGAVLWHSCAGILELGRAPAAVKTKAKSGGKGKIKAGRAGGAAVAPWPSPQQIESLEDLRLKPEVAALVDQVITGLVPPPQPSAGGTVLECGVPCERADEAGPPAIGAALDSGGRVAPAAGAAAAAAGEVRTSHYLIECRMRAVRVIELWRAVQIGGEGPDMKQEARVAAPLVTPVCDASEVEVCIGRSDAPAAESASETRLPSEVIGSAGPVGAPTVDCDEPVGRGMRFLQRLRRVLCASPHRVVRRAHPGESPHGGGDGVALSEGSLADNHEMQPSQVWRPSPVQCDAGLGRACCVRWLDCLRCGCWGLFECDMGGASELVGGRACIAVRSRCHCVVSMHAASTTDPVAVLVCPALRRLCPVCSLQ